MTLMYRSQWDADALARREDCGPACVAMILGPSFKINDLSTHVMPNDVGTDAGDLIHLLNDHGVKANRWTGPDRLKLPAICLVKYSGFDRANVQDVNFMGWHWLIWLENLPDTSAIVLDPDWWAPRRNEGDHKHYTAREWGRAFIPYGAEKVAVEWEQEVADMATMKVTVGGQVLNVNTPFDIRVEDSAPVANRWTADFFNGTTPTGPVIYTTTYPGPGLELNWGAGSPNAAVPVDNFSARFTQVLTMAGGMYQWKVRSDDGFRMKVDGIQVTGLDGWIQQSAASKEYVGQFKVEPGVHTLTVDYCEFGGLAELHVSAPLPL